MIRKGRITKIYKDDTTTAKVVQGIKREFQEQFENRPGVAGSNGSYACNFHTEPSIKMNVCLYGVNGNDNDYIQTDIYEDVRRINNVDRVSRQLLDKIIKMNEGNKVTVEIQGNHVGFRNGLDLEAVKNSTPKYVELCHTVIE